MALLQFDGFDGTTAAELSSLYGYTVGGTPTMVAGRFAGAFNSQAVQFSGNNTTDYLDIALGATLTQYVTGCAIQFANNTAEQRILTGRNGATEAWNIVKSTGGILSIRAGTSVTNLATGTTALTGGTWYYLEVKHNYTGAGNPTLTVRVNGVDEVTYTGSLNGVTANTKVILGASFSTIICPPTFKIDDRYLVDFTGSTNNDFLGDVRVELLVPDSETSNSGFTANTGTTFGAVDDATQDGDTTYVHGNAVSSAIKFGVSNLSDTPSTIFGVSVQAVAKKTDAGTRNIKTALLSDATTVSGSTQTLTTSYAAGPVQIAELDPDGNVAWTQAAVQAVSIGIEILT